MKIQPFGNNIYYEPTKDEQPMGVQLCKYGDVIAIGKDVKEVQVGDIIIFGEWGVNEIEINGKKEFFVAEDSAFLLAKFTV